MEDKLKQYRQKRDFNKTKEPRGTKRNKSQKLHFVVQHHLASHDHYDFRLEWNGTLKSWAIPKGPSYNPKDKRLAVMVEDHPLEYRHFEGVIPQGEYGGGTVMIFDEGEWEPIGKMGKSFPKDMLKFTLKGKRLKGSWTLVHFKEDNWLLIKEEDEFYEFADINTLKRSIKTKRTMEQIARQSKSASVIDGNQKIVENIPITHPDKVVFARPRITKWDIAMYYEQVSRRMMPFIDNRLISVIRAPQGMAGEHFFKKHLDNDNPGIGKKIVPNDKNHKEDYYYIKDVEGLISEVQMNSFEFHIWGSEVDQLEHPNMMVFDFDPDEDLDIGQLRQGVVDLKSILDDLKLPSFLKTSGGKGYHVVVPIKQHMTWRKFRMTAKNIAELMEAKWPDRYTSNVRLKNRHGRIFIDWIRNTRSATSVAPYSLRLRDNCPVSMPIPWRDLYKVKPNEIGLKEALKRLKRKDPWEDFFN